MWNVECTGPCQSTTPTTNTSPWPARLALAQNPARFCPAVSISLTQSAFIFPIQLHSRLASPRFLSFRWLMFDYAPPTKMLFTGMWTTAQSQSASPQPQHHSTSQSLPSPSSPLSRLLFPAHPSCFLRPPLRENEREGRHTQLDDIPNHAHDQETHADRLGDAEEFALVG